MRTRVVRTTFILLSDFVLRACALINEPECVDDCLIDEFLIVCKRSPTVCAVSTVPGVIDWTHTAFGKSVLSFVDTL